MLKRSILWITPFVFMALIAGYFVLTPILSTSAAGWNGH